MSEMCRNDVKKVVQKAIAVIAKTEQKISRLRRREKEKLSRIREGYNMAVEEQLKIRNGVLNLLYGLQKGCKFHPQTRRWYGHCGVCDYTREREESHGHQAHF
ncbi:MAG: hypothetical protein HYT12_00700 [Candidatus Liptonbacteria bacterium]|nr:hypothetical protein [Candidatus Liptonbacteria bacterium]